MTEEKNTMNPEESVPVEENPSDVVAKSSASSGITPLIPGTEIVGRRARRAALQVESSDPAAVAAEATPAADLPAFAVSEGESATEPEESAEAQILLWDDPLSEDASDGADQIPLWDDTSLDELLARAQSWATGDGDLSDLSESVEDPSVAERSETVENSEDAQIVENTGDEGSVADPGDASEKGADGGVAGSDLPETDSEEFWNQLLTEDYYTPIEQIPRRRRPGESDGSGGRRGKRPAGEIDDRLKRSSNKPKACAVSPFVEFVEVVVGALVAAILVLTLICRTGVVDGSSMVPTMYHGDRYIISDLFYVPERGDIVVFRPEIDGEDELWIKRVIATEGQTVYIDPESYQVYVDGRLLSEPYLGGAGTIPHSTENPITVPEGCVYVLGDNRAISHDSRYADLGCVEIGQLAGRVILRFWPLESFGFCE